MPRSVSRRTNSVYARPASATATATNVQAASRANTAARAPAVLTTDAPPVILAAPSSDSAILLTISAQMNQFADGLAAAQRSCATTEALLVEKLAEHRILIEDTRSAASAESKALSTTLQVQFQHSSPNFAWRGRGNEAQHVYNCTVLNNWIEVATAQENEDHVVAKEFVQKGIRAVLLRNKCCKLADASPAGWALVEEYLANSLADDDDDDRKIRRCEAAALDKKRRRLDESANNKSGNNNNNKRGRGANNYKGAGRGKSETTEPASTPVPAAPPALDPYTLSMLTSSLQAFASSPLGGGKSTPRKLGPCFICQGDHLQNDCPYYKAQRAAYQQQFAASIANAPGNAK
jgi:hypothetical protein